MRRRWGDWCLKKTATVPAVRLRNLAKDDSKEEHVICWRCICILCKRVIHLEYRSSYPTTLSVRHQMYPNDARMTSTADFRTLARCIQVLRTSQNSVRVLSVTWDLSGCLNSQTGVSLTNCWKPDKSGERKWLNWWFNTSRIQVIIQHCHHSEVCMSRLMIHSLSCDPECNFQHGTSYWYEQLVTAWIVYPLSHLSIGWMP